MDFRSPLSKARGLGSAKEGAHHWWMQRITAVALVPLVIYTVFLLIKINSNNIFHILSSPFNAVLLILFFLVSLYHGYLGLKVVIEDYVHCNCARPLLIFLVLSVTAVTMILVSLSISYGHITGANYNKKRKWRMERSSYMERSIYSDKSVRSEESLKEPIMEKPNLEGNE